MCVCVYLTDLETGRKTDADLKSSGAPSKMASFRELCEIVNDSLY